MNALLIAGTDTGIGKTVLTTALAAYWQRHRASRSLGVLKLVQYGLGTTEGDRDRPSELALHQPTEPLNSVQFQAQLAPAIAAERLGSGAPLETAWHQFERLSQTRDFVLVESSGGLGSPMTYETTVADLAWDWRIPTVLVVPVQPGAIAQAVANVALARQSRVHLKGIVLNCRQPCHMQELEDWAPADLLQSLTQKPVLGCIPHLADPTDLNKLVQVTSNLDLERLLP